MAQTVSSTTTCKFKGCNKPAVAYGICRLHYPRARFDPGYEDLLPDEMIDNLKLCTIDGCDRRMYARGWCRLHYNRWWHSGIPEGKGHHGVRLRNGTKICEVVGCNGEVLAHGKCRIHYDVSRRMRDPDRIKEDIEKAIEKLERYAFADELWPEGKKPEDIAWLG